VLMSDFRCLPALRLPESRRKVKCDEYNADERLRTVTGGKSGDCDLPLPHTGGAHRPIQVKGRPKGGLRCKKQW